MLKNATILQILKTSYSSISKNKIICLVALNNVVNQEEEQNGE
jgi:hypothetical protein